MTDALNQFARHLLHCLRQELVQRPGPFRQVDFAPRLPGAAGSEPPALVFWINRESFFAGGLLLLPPTGRDVVPAGGAARAAAFGLPVYHSWGVTGIAAWSLPGEATAPLWELPVPASVMAAPEGLLPPVRQLLADLQQRFFDSQTKLPRLSPEYLEHLLHAACDQLQPALLATNPRLPERQNRVPSALRHRLLQLLNLAWSGDLPTPAGPDELADALDAASRRLADAHGQAHRVPDTAIRFSGEAARLLHRLVLRLSQFGPELPPLLPATLDRLLPFWLPVLGGMPLPTEPGERPADLLLFPDRCMSAEQVRVEIGTPGLLAATATRRRFAGEPGSVQQLDDPLRLVAPLAVQQASGTLAERARPAPRDGHAGNARLRVSWPNRNINLPASAPTWAWHLLHLAGVLPATAQLDLKLPEDWLTVPPAEQVYGLLTERFALRAITVSDDGLHRVRLAPLDTVSRIELTTVGAPPRHLEGSPAPTLFQLRLALLLPEPLRQLVDRGELHLPEATGVQPPVDAVALFLRSTPGRLLWRLLQPGRPAPSADRALAACRQHGIPLPRAEILAALQGLARLPHPPKPAILDRELADWLGQGCLQLDLPRRRNPAVPALEAQRPDAAVAAAATRAGVLRFPEDFLYAIPAAGLRRFPATDPLHLVETFFAAATLATASGERHQVDGLATARALILASAIGKREITLPVSDHEVELLLQRYAGHLREVYATLMHEAAQHPAIDVEATVERVWATLPVPDRRLALEHLPQCGTDMV